MKEQKDVGLEDVNILDFTEDEPVEEKPKTEKKIEEKLEGIQSYPWKSVSHVVIGPNGVSLVPTGTEKKFSLPQTQASNYPTPGRVPTMLEYDLEHVLGTVNEAGNLEKELANTRAELEKVKAELAVFKCKPKADAPPVEDPDKDKKPVGMAAPPPEEEILPVPGSAPQGVDEPDKKKKKPEEVLEKSKEEIAKDELKEAAIKEKTEEEKKAEDHNGNLADAIKLMQVAKKRNLL